MKIGYMHFCLPINTTAGKLFKCLNDYISGELIQPFCIDTFTDDSAAMTGWLSGFTILVNEITSECDPVCCEIHREVLPN